MKRFVSVVTTICMIAGGTIMPVHAADSEIGEAYSTLQQEAISTYSYLSIPEGLEKIMLQEVQAYDLNTISMNQYEWQVLYLTNKIRMK